MECLIIHPPCYLLWHIAVDRLIETVKREYYYPRGLPLATEICSPVAGAGLI
ncbi:MAG: hypothetical protein V1800_15655 [Candidatus Latescibacterota bacterium]